MARIKYYNTKTGKWEYADSSFVVGGNGSGGNVELDTTLTQSGKAADAKAVGDALEKKLSADKLPEAVNDALAQAKASGEFKGDPGEPGQPGTPGAPGDDYVLTPADKTEIAEMAAELVEVPESSGGGIAVTGAKVGQTVKISAVDENGVPTAWEPTDFPSGGGGSENDNDWEVINVLEFTEEGISSFTIDKDKDGNPFELSDMKLISDYQASIGGKWDGGARTRLVLNGHIVNPDVGKLSTASRHFLVFAFLVNNRIYMGNSNFDNATHTYDSLSIRPVEELNDDSITSIGIKIDWPETGYFAVGYKLTLWGRRKK